MTGYEQSRPGENAEPLRALAPGIPAAWVTERLVEREAADLPK
jgi:hypothetical protein